MPTRPAISPRTAHWRGSDGRELVLQPEGQARDIVLADGAKAVEARFVATSADGRAAPPHLHPAARQLRAAGARRTGQYGARRDLGRRRGTPPGARAAR
jgi:hypothetical protein